MINRELMCTMAFLEQEQGKHKAELDAQKGDLSLSLKEIHRLLRVELGDHIFLFLDILRFLSFARSPRPTNNLIGVPTSFSRINII